MKPTKTITMPAKNTVALSELSTAAMAAGNDQRFVRVIMRGVVIHFTGWGWENEGPPTTEQLRVLPRVAND